MHVTDAQVYKLTEKLIEAFSIIRWQDGAFRRYWPMAGGLEDFCASAHGEIEEAVAHALRNGLERRLVKAAPNDQHPDAWAITDLWPFPRSDTRKPRTPKQW